MLAPVEPGPELGRLVEDVMDEDGDMHRPDLEALERRGRRARRRVIRRA